MNLLYERTLEAALVAVVVASICTRWRWKDTVGNATLSLGFWIWSVIVLLLGLAVANDQAQTAFPQTLPYFARGRGAIDLLLSVILTIFAVGSACGVGLALVGPVRLRSVGSILGGVALLVVYLGTLGVGWIAWVMFFASYVGG